MVLFREPAKKALFLNDSMTYSLTEKVLAALEMSLAILKGSGIFPWMIKLFNM
jgi:hypothetical protein